MAASRCPSQVRLLDAIARLTKCFLHQQAAETSQGSAHERDKEGWISRFGTLKKIRAGWRSVMRGDGNGPYQALPGAAGVARRGTGMLIAICVASVCVLAVAVSTREEEFEAYTGFAAGAEETAVSKAVLPQGPRAVMLHALGLGEPARRAQSLDEGDAPMTADDLDSQAETWAAAHPKEMRRIAGSFAVGLALGLVGVVCLIWSEITCVLTVRELDRNAWSGEPKPADLAEREALWAHGFRAMVRPWLSLGGIVLMLSGFLVALLPMCAILVDFGLPAAPTEEDCVTSMVLLAVLDVIGFAALLVSLCWVCTRPWASMILTSVALGANICVMLKSPVFIICWVVLSGFLAFWYFQYIPEAAEGYVPKPDMFSFYHPAYRGDYYQRHNGHTRPNAPPAQTHYV